MREIQIIDWCDLCYAADESKEPAHEERIADSRLLVLCKNHADHIDELKAALDSAFALGEKVATKSRPTAARGAGLPTQCPLCPHNSTTRQGLGAHLKTAHETGFRKLREEGHDI